MPYACQFARILTLCFSAEMSSSYDLYKGNNRSKRKAKTGESSQASAKRAKVVEPEVVPEVPSTVPVVEVEDSPSRAAVPEAQIFEEPAAEVEEELPSAAEPVVEDVAQVFEKVISMSTDRVQKLATHRKYSKAASSFVEYNFGQAFSRGLNDIAMVSSPRSLCLTIFYQHVILTDRADLCFQGMCGLHRSWQRFEDLQ